MPVLDGTCNALVAVRGALAHRDFRQRPARSAARPSRRGSAAERRRRAEQLVRDRGRSTKPASLALLAAYDVPVVPHRVVDSEAAAVAAAARLGFPVALKTAMPGILHKTERGGVHLDLADEAGRASRLARSRQTARPARPRRAHDAEGRGARARHGARPAVRAARHRRRGGVLIELLVRSARRARAVRTRYGARVCSTVLRCADSSTAIAAASPSTSTVSRSRSAVFRCSPPTSSISSREIDVNPLVCGREIAAVDALFVQA